jgi:hypothetical protein
MAQPTIIDIPHTLSREEAKRRMAARVGKLASHIPGGAATVTHSWPSADRMLLTVSTMGIEVPCTIDAEDTRLRVTVNLSGMLSLMTGPIAAVIRSQGERLMVEDKSAA